LDLEIELIPRRVRRRFGRWSVVVVLGVISSLIASGIIYLLPGT